MAKKVNNQIIDDWIMEHRPQTKRIGPYTHSLALMEFQCECGNVWLCSWNRFSTKMSKCEKCSKKIHWTNELIDEWIIINRPECKRLGNYKKKSEPILMQCECGNRWYTLFSSFQKGCQCKECGTKKTSNFNRKSDEDIDSWIKINRPNTRRIGKHKKSRVLNLFQCECGEIWETTFDSFKRGAQCPKCAIEKRAEKNRKTNIQYEQECLSCGYKPLEEYKGSKTPIKHVCLDCGNIFIAAPEGLLRLAVKCPKCKRRKSKYELIIESMLNDNNIFYESQYAVCINNHCHYFDFYIKDLNLFIEADGEGHYYPVNFGGMSDEEAQDEFQNRRIRDAEKDMFCHWNKHNLLRLPYFLSKDEIIQQLEAALKGE